MDQSIRGSAITAGAGILLMSALAGFGNFVAVEGLVTPGNAAQTAQDITGSEGLFRAGIACLFLVIVLDVIVACALYRVFSPVSRGVSMLGAAFRLVFAGVFLVALGRLLEAPDLLGGTDGVFSTDQSNALALLEINAFTDLWVVGLGLFGCHLLVVGYLAYRSGYVPRVLGVLLAIAGLGYLADSLGAMVSESWTEIAAYTFVGEFLLAVWLVVRGGRLTAIRQLA